jgi:hypothetical protein
LNLKFRKVSPRYFFEGIGHLFPKLFDHTTNCARPGTGSFPGPFPEGRRANPGTGGRHRKTPRALRKPSPRFFRNIGHLLAKLFQHATNCARPETGSFPGPFPESRRANPGTRGRTPKNPASASKTVVAFFTDIGHLLAKLFQHATNCARSGNGSFPCPISRRPRDGSGEGMGRPRKNPRKDFETPARPILRGRRGRGMPNQRDFWRRPGTGRGISENGSRGTSEIRGRLAGRRGRTRGQIGSKRVFWGGFGHFGGQ